MIEIEEINQLIINCDYSQAINKLQSTYSYKLDRANFYVWRKLVLMERYNDAMRYVNEFNVNRILIGPLERVNKMKALYYLGLMYERRNDYKKAKYYYGRLLNHGISNITDTELLRFLISVFYKMNDAKKLNETVSIYARLTDPYKLIGSSIKKGRYKLAFQILTKRHNEAYSSFYMWRELISLKRYKDASRYAGRFDIDTFFNSNMRLEKVRTIYFLGVMYSNLNDSKKANNYYRRLVRYHVNNIDNLEVLELLAYAAAVTGNGSKLSEVAEKYNSIVKNGYRLVDVMLERGWWKCARDVLCLKNSKEFSSFYVWRKLMALRKYTVALEYAKKFNSSNLFNSLEERSYRIQSLYYRGLMYEKLKQYKNAGKIYKQLARYKLNNKLRPELLELLFEAAKKIKNTERKGKIQEKYTERILDYRKHVGHDIAKKRYENAINKLEVNCSKDFACFYVWQRLILLERYEDAVKFFSRFNLDTLPTLAYEYTEKIWAIYYAGIMYRKLGNNAAAGRMYNLLLNCQIGAITNLKLLDCLIGLFEKANNRVKLAKVQARYRELNRVFSGRINIHIERGRSDLALRKMRIIYPLSFCKFYIWRELVEMSKYGEAQKYADGFNIDTISEVTYRMDEKLKVVYYLGKMHQNSNKLELAESYFKYLELANVEGIKNMDAFELLMGFFVERKNNLMLERCRTRCEILLRQDGLYETHNHILSLSTSAINTLSSDNLGERDKRKVVRMFSNILNLRDRENYSYIFGTFRSFIIRLAKCDARDMYGNSPLHIAAHFNDEDVATVLVQYSNNSNDIFFKNKEGDIPLQKLFKGGFRYFPRYEFRIHTLLRGKGVAFDPNTNKLYFILGNTVRWLTPSTRNGWFYYLDQGEYYREFGNTIFVLGKIIKTYAEKQFEDSLALKQMIKVTGNVFNDQDTPVFIHEAYQYAILEKKPSIAKFLQDECGADPDFVFPGENDLITLSDRVEGKKYKRKAVAIEDRMEVNSISAENLPKVRRKKRKLRHNSCDGKSQGFFRMPFIEERESEEESKKGPPKPPPFM